MFQNFYHNSGLNGNGADPKVCYCGKGRNLDVIELQCERCTKWFHQSCIKLELPRLVKFLTCYNFVCKDCHPKGDEAFEKKTTSKCKLLCYLFCFLGFLTFFYCFFQHSLKYVKQPSLISFSENSHELAIVLPFPKTEKLFPISMNIGTC